jgi:hypothetical protein
MVVLDTEKSDNAGSIRLEGSPIGDEHNIADFLSLPG